MTHTVTEPGLEVVCDGSAAARQVRGRDNEADSDTRLADCQRASNSAEELDYRLVKELWAFAENRIAVRFAYEFHDDSGNWFRSYGNENWEFNENGLMQPRFASINDLPIKESDRKLHWPFGRRPDDHPGLSDLGF